MSDDLHQNDNGSEMNDGVNEPHNPGAMDDYDDDFDAAHRKISHGNRGMFAVFALMLVVGGIVAFLWYRDKSADDQWDTRLKAAFTLHNDSEINAALRDIAKESKQNNILEQVAYELGLAKDMKAAPILIDLLPRGGEVARQSAVALARIGGEGAKLGADSIYTQMQATKDLARAEMAWALCILGDERGVPDLLEGLGKRLIDEKAIPEFDADVALRVASTSMLIETATHTDPMLRMYAANELGYRQDADTVPPLLKLLEDPKDDIAKAAAVSLGRLNDERSGPALIRAIESKPAIKDPVIVSVARSVGAPGLEAIYRNLKSPEDQLKVVVQLKKLRDPRGADLLLEIINQEYPTEKAKNNSKLRDQALWALEDLGEPRAAEAMVAKTRWEKLTAEQVEEDAARYQANDRMLKIANSVPNWLGRVQPEGTAGYLRAIYKENEPFDYSAEAAGRVKVDISPLLDAMGRSGDASFCSVIEPFLPKEDAQVAAFAMGRLKCKGARKKFVRKMEMTKEERIAGKFATNLESRDWMHEKRLQERKNSIVAVRYLEDPAVAKALIAIAMDPQDDVELRTEAAVSLAYVADEGVTAELLGLISDDSLDQKGRGMLIRGLWRRPNPAVVDKMLAILKGRGNHGLVRPASALVGEYGAAEHEAVLNELLDHPDETRRRGAVYAILLGGNLEALARIKEVLSDEESMLVVRDWFSTHPVFLDEGMFSSNRLLKRLTIAGALKDEFVENVQLIWAWRRLMDRLKVGDDAAVDGLTALQVREELADVVRHNGDYREIAASVLAGLGERGYLLTLQAEADPQKTAARNALRRMVSGSI